MGNALKWVMLVAIVYIFIMVFFSSNNIIQGTQPKIVGNDTANASLLAKQANQTNQYIDLTSTLLPGLLILAGAWVVLKVFTDT